MKLKICPGIRLFYQEDKKYVRRISCIQCQIKVKESSDIINCVRSDRAHLDYHQDDGERERFYRQFPLPPQIIMGDRHRFY